MTERLFERRMSLQYGRHQRGQRESLMVLVSPPLPFEIGFTPGVVLMISIVIYLIV